MRRVAVLVRLIGFLRGRWQMVAAAALLAAWTIAANVGLLAVAAYLISLSALKPPLSYLIPSVFLVQLLGGSRAFTRYAERIVSHDLTFGMLKEIRLWLYRRLRPLAPAKLSGSRSGDLLSLLTGDVEELQNLYLRAAAPILVAISVSALTGFALYVVYPPLAAIALISLAVVGVGIPLAVWALQRGVCGKEPAQRAELEARMVDGMWGSAELLAASRAEDAAREISALGERLGRSQRRSALVGGLREALDDLVAGLATLGVLLVAIPQAEAGVLGGVYLALIALLTLGSFEAVRPVGEAIQALSGVLASGERIFEIADESPAVEDPPSPAPVPEGRSIELCGVGFGYRPDQPRALEEVSLRVREGRKVAVVGPSGAGKSTLVSLLLRFWEPDEGAILLDGRDLRDYAQEDARSALAVAAQDEHIFAGTVRENLLLARPEATEYELKEALAAALLGDLTGALEREVGESGGRLSGGERRRLSVARAFLRRSPLLVLDEPTADLDTATERRLLESAHRLSRGMLLITHRLVGMERMDEILVLGGGRVVERGTHGELLRAGGPYSSLLEAQDRILAS